MAGAMQVLCRSDRVISGRKFHARSALVRQNRRDKPLDVISLCFNGRLKPQRAECLSRDRADACDSYAVEFLEILLAKQRCEILRGAAAGECYPGHTFVLQRVEQLAWQCVGPTSLVDRQVAHIGG